MTKICFIRHGETDWNVEKRLQGTSDVPLNDFGELQAHWCKEYLMEGHWDVIVTSPLVRARKTAEIINEKLHLPLIVMEEFKERFFGDAEGMSLEERKSLFPFGQYTNQESRARLNNRLQAGLNRLKDDYKGKNILLISHGAVISSMIRMFEEDESKYCSISNASFTTLEFIDAEWKVTSSNVTKHLDKMYTLAKNNEGKR
jgi:uncharacterized phosphatase